MLKRTHRCGEPRAEQVGQEVIVSGWVANWRDHGGLVFIDLRDRTGIVQVVFRPETDAEMHAAARALRSEYCHQRARHAGAPAARDGEPLPAHRRGRTRRRRAGDPQHLREPALRRGDHRRGVHRGAPALPLPGPAPPAHAAQPGVPPPPDADRAALPGRERLPRGRDAVPDQEHARGRARLPGAQPHQPGQVLRPAAEPAALQADADGRRHGPLLPDRQVLPRRGPARRTASRSSPRSTWRCRSSSPRTCWPWSRG